MRILFLGNFLPREYENRFLTLSAAGNQYQNNLIKALRKDNEVFSITYSGLPEVRLSEDEREELRRAGIVTCLPKVDGYYNFFNYRAAIRKAAQNADCIITYNIIYLWFGLRRLIRNDKCKLILILADYTPPKEEHGWRKVYSWIMGRQFSKFDKVVLLSENSKSYIEDENKCEIINGCIDWSMFEKMRMPEQNEECIIAYTGFISKVTGIELLIKAFERMRNRKCKLIISGQIDDQEKDFLERACRNNPNIDYWGYVDKKSYIALLQKSDILVNPRDMSFRQNQYNFPSKILEYLASGRIIVSTKFSGYRKYENFINFCESTPDALAEHLVDCMEKKNEISREFYDKNRAFVQQFTWEKQVGRFL